MSRPMNKGEARAWMAGWNALKERERAELLGQSYQEKFAALAFLMASVDLFDRSALDVEDLETQRRWTRLQRLAARD